MKSIRTLLSLVLALCLCLGSFAFAEDEVVIYQLGDKIEDFTVTTWDDKTVTLSEILKEKEMVLINIWATWCGPCRSEFPFMQEAYTQYSDKVEVVALSCEETDTPDVLAGFVADMGLTFPVAQDTPDFATKFNVTGIPTSIAVDRFGTICFIESGALPDVASFNRLFDAFLGDGYDESVVYHGIPPVKPNVAPAAEADLAAALNVEGGTLAFTNGADEYDWPMTVTEIDGNSVVVSSNVNISDSAAKVNAAVTAKAGDAIVVTFKTSTEAGYDVMSIAVNGEIVKCFGGEKEWMTYAWSVPADGDYTVTLAYTKDATSDGGADTVWIDSVALLTGDEATVALNGNPIYPVADELTVTAVNEGAKQIIIDDPDGVLPLFFGECDYYLIGGDTATFKATLPADIDPEIATFYTNYDGSSDVTTNGMVEDGYTFTCGVDSAEVTGYPYANLYLYYSMQGDALGITYCRDEANVNALIAMLNEYGANLPGTWQYADGTLPAGDGMPQKTVEAGGMSTYVLTFVDQNGAPVEGVMAQICDDATCQVAVSDASGVCELTLAPYAWEIHILKAPEGYTADTETVVTAPVEGGELTFTLTRN